MNDAAARPSRGGYVATLLLVSSVVTWRQGDLYSGGVDPVVAAKAVLGVLAALLAHRAALRSTRQRLDGRPLLFLTTFLGMSLLGALATGTTFVASAVLVVRLAIIAFTVYQLCLALPFDRLGLALAGSMGLFVAAATLTGSTAGDQRTGAGRLIGGIPALQPNEIAQLCGLTVLLLLWNGIAHRGRMWHGPAVLLLVYVVWLTGSRTALAFLVAGVLVLIVVARRFNLGFVLTFLLLVPLAAYSAVTTSSISDYFNRGGSTNLTTFNQRTVAWSAALHVHTGFWDIWFGNGLSVVTVPVVAQFRSEQLLDSSWLSALVQSGIVGAVVLGAWLVQVAVSLTRTPRLRRSLLLALSAFVLLLATFQSGLVSATPLFVVFLVVGLTAGPDRSADPEPVLTGRRSRISPPVASST